MATQGHPDIKLRSPRGMKSLAVTALAAFSVLAFSVTAVSAQAEKPSAPNSGAKPQTAIAVQSLGEAAISNQVLRIVLRSSAQISLYNARGQMLYQGESQRGVATLPLKSIDFGFLFLTLRQGQVEQTLRLLHNGK
jgi:photosystem II stability/assembly factor-like uncharacterized protein